MRFVRATGVSRGSYSKSSEFFFQISLRFTGGSWHETYKVYFINIVGSLYEMHEMIT
jgi:hypothetical protein